GGKLGEKPAGTLKAEFQTAKLNGTLATEARLEGRTLSIPRLRLAAGRTVIEANLQSALDTLLTAGSVKASLPDLAEWSELSGLSLSGAADLNVQLRADRTQRATLALSASDIGAATAGTLLVKLRRLT